MDEAEFCNRVALINQGRLVAVGSPVELKQHGLGGDLLLIECLPLGASIGVLEGAPGVRDVAVFGNSLHVVVDNGSEAQEALRLRLADQGLAATRIEAIEPTLEDVFVRLVASDAAAGARAA